MPQPSVSLILLLRHDDVIMRRCITSLSQQTLSDVEIVVSDCTYRGFSDALTKKLMQMSEHVKMIQHAPTTSRWNQLREAVDSCRAPYVMFVESTRWLENDAAEVALTAVSANHAEVAEMRTARCIKGMTVRNDNPVTEGLADRMLAGSELRDYSRFIGEGSYISPSIYDKIYRRDLLLEALAIDYPAEGGCEEILNIQYMRYARSMMLLSYSGVCYNWQENDLKQYTYSDLKDAKESYTHKLLNGQDRESVRQELETRLRRHVSSLVLDKGWTREATLFFMTAELKNHFWQQAGITVSAEQLLREVDARDRRQDLTRVFRRLLR